MPNTVRLLVFGILCVGVAGRGWGQWYASGQPAVSVLGAGDFNWTQFNWPSGAATGSNQATPVGFNTVNDVAIDPASGKLFVADSGNSRVLRFGAAEALMTGAAAEAVFGQANFSGDVTNRGDVQPTAGSLSQPGGLWVDAQGNLWVADTYNNRVLRFANAATAQSGVPATQVFGSGFNSRNSATTASGLNFPTDIITDAAGNLYIADTENHRVVMHVDAASKGNSPAADKVFGQVNFTASEAIDTASRLERVYRPTGLAFDDGGRLFVAGGTLPPFSSELTEGLIPKILRFDGMAGKSSSAPADGWIAMTPTVAPNHTFHPPGFTLFSTATMLLAWNSPAQALFVGPSTMWYDNPAAAPTFVEPNGILGGPANFFNIFSEQARDADEGSRMFYGSTSVAVGADGTLWIAAFHRVLRLAPLTGRLPTVTVRGPKRIRTNKRELSFRGEAWSEAGLMWVEGKGRGRLRQARSLTPWRMDLPLKPKRTRVLIRSVDGAGKRSLAASIVVTRRRASNDRKR